MKLPTDPKTLAIAAGVLALAGGGAGLASLGVGDDGQLGPDYAAPGVPWKAIDPTGEGRKDPVIRDRMVKAAQQLHAFAVWCGVPSLVISPHGGYQPPNPPPGWPERSNGSQHRFGAATDCYPPKGWSIGKFHAAALAFMEARGKGGLGFYTWGVHLDVRQTAHLVQWGSIKPAEAA